MAWIESHQALGRHPKTLRLAALLRVRVPEAVGLLQYLWWWALDYAPDGLVAEGDIGVVAQACMWHGKPQLFWDGLLGAGFVEDAGLDVLRIHDWMDYAGRLVEQRAANVQRMREYRARSVQERERARYGATNRTNQPDIPDTPDRTNKPAAAAAATPVAREFDGNLLAEHERYLARERAIKASSSSS